MDLASFVIPVQGDAYVLFPILFGRYFVDVFQSRLEMWRMAHVLANILDTEIINYERELNGVPIVFPEAWDQFALSVAMLIESFFEELIG